MNESHENFIRAIVKRNRYLTLATTDGADPWIAPLEYISDDDLNLYFFSPEYTAHSKHLELRPTAAVAIFDPVQPEYELAPEVRIAGTQIRATVRKLEPPYPALVEEQIQVWMLPMPPYAAYQIVADEWFLPTIRNGVNKRIVVPMRSSG